MYSEYNEDGRCIAKPRIEKINKQKYWRQVYTQILNFIFKPIDVHTTNQSMLKHNLHVTGLQNIHIKGKQTGKIQF